MTGSVRLPVRLSVRHTFFIMFPSYHHEIFMKWVITMDRIDVHAKGQGRRSKVKITKVNTQISRFS